jgi:hypothetical protein
MAVYGNEMMDNELARKKEKMTQGVFNWRNFLILPTVAFCLYLSISV